MSPVLAAQRPTRRQPSWNDRDTLRAILDSIPVNVFVCDMQMRLVYLSPTAAQTMEALREAVMSEFGVNVDDLLGLSIHSFHKDPVGVERILGRPETFPHHASFALAGLQLLTTITAITDRSGQITGYLAVVDNITDKHQLAQHLSQAAADLGESSLHLAGLAEELDATTAEVTRQAAAMANGSEELSASIQAVSRSTAHVASGTRQVIESATSATDSVAKLSDSSSRIGDVVGLITSIAEQTKLLALNATIEATRAGAAGSGFAVVASEVKDLAQRTRMATDQIAEMVAAIQGDSNEAATAIAAILGGIERVGSEQAEISATVDQEAESAREISSVVDEVVHSIGGIASATGAAREAAAALSTKAAELDQLVAGVQT
jgi:methyl-accepting chemotaxis protein